MSDTVANSNSIPLFNGTTLEDLQARMNASEQRLSKAKVAYNIAKNAHMFAELEMLWHIRGRRNAYERYLEARQAFDECAEELSYARSVYAADVGAYTDAKRVLENAK